MLLIELSSGYGFVSSFEDGLKGDGGSLQVAGGAGPVERTILFLHILLI